MEKTYKPVPDVECLKYHGTPEKPDIKIFVSHRIDQESETIDNPLYIPVRCGAIYDDREDVTMLGDDTGDNISEKRMSYCELTVQYWAWKNVQADYYGFCTSQKYLGVEKPRKGPDVTETMKLQNFSMMGTLADAKDRIDSWNKDITQIIGDYDVISLHDTVLPKKSYQNVNEYLIDDIFHFDGKVITEFLKVIQYRFPNMLRYANKYFSSNRVQTESLFIARKDIFNEFCQFQFAVLDTLLTRIDLSHVGAERKKVFSLLGIHLWGIFLCSLKRKVRIKYLYGVYFSEHRKMPVVFKKKKKNNIPVVFSSSNSFAPYLGVALKSMMNTISKESNYDIIVLEKNIEDEEKRKLLSICENKVNVSLRFINTKSLVSNINFYVPTKDLSEETYYTVLVPWILRNYNKALVLDCDIIINHDVALLYNTDLGDLYIGAVKEIVYLGFLNNPVLNANDSLTEYTEIKLGLKNPYDYFNAGVLLMNLSKFRENYSMATFFDMIDNNQFSIVEQDLLNSVCADKVLFLDYSWNFMSCLSEPSIIDEKLSLSDTTIPNLKLAPENEILLYEEASQHPYIYHYLTRLKPWKCPYLKYADVWWKIARTTVYYETFIYQLSQNAGKRIDDRVSNLELVVFDLQNRMGIFDTRSGARKLADKLLPKGSRRREFAKKLLPKGSLGWRFCKQIYYVFRPKYRPVKAEITTDEETED